MTEKQDFLSVYYQSSDGLRLFARDYNAAGLNFTPVLCLPGLTRNSRDFETIAPWLARTRRIICPDFRGRGKSGYATDPSCYRPDVELADTIALLDHLQVARVAVIGTSRGGLVGMLMSAMHRDRMAGLMLNDIGSALDMEGLLRIRSYIGKTVVFENFAAAADMLKQQNVGFHNLADEAWLAFARRLFRPVPGGVVADYDPALAATFVSFDDIKAGRASDVRKIYSTTAGMPVSVLRGANSDLLSSATVAEMQTHNPDLDATTVADRGHAPFLDETESVAAISRWLQRVDENEGLR